MIKDITEKGSWLLFLLPGFVAFATARFLSNMSDLSEFEQTVIFFGISLTIYALIILLVHAIYLLNGLSLEITKLIISPIFHSAAILIGFGMGVFFAVAYEQDWSRSWMREIVGKSNLPKASSHLTLDVLFRSMRKAGENQTDFRSPPQKYRSIFVAVTVDKKRYVGDPRRWASSGESAQVYLSPACVEYKGTSKLVNGPGVWLNLAKVNVIEILDRRAPEKCPSMLTKHLGDTCVAKYLFRKKPGIAKQDCLHCSNTTDDVSFGLCMCKQLNNPPTCSQCVLNSKNKSVDICIREHANSNRQENTQTPIPPIRQTKRR